MAEALKAPGQHFSIVGIVVGHQESAHRGSSLAAGLLGAATLTFGASGKSSRGTLLDAFGGAHREAPVAEVGKHEV